MKDWDFAMMRKQANARRRRGLSLEALEVRHLLTAATAVDDSFTIQEDTTLVVQSMDTNLVPQGSIWRYLDDGSDQGTAWREQGFDDSGWQFGPAQLGYGDGDEATVVGFGEDEANKFPTTYFRHTFDIASTSEIISLTMEVLRDDGIAVYLNGTEVVLDGLVSDPTYLDFSTNVIGGNEESVYTSYTIDPSLLVAGTNTLAAEIHQANPNSSDISFDLGLTAVAGSGGILANDVDPDGDILTAHLVTAPAHGSVALNADGSLAYFPDVNFHGTDSFTYVANDGTEDSNEATVSVVVQPVNDAPVARANQYHALRNTELVVPVEIGVLANDTEYDGDALRALVTQSTSHGTLTMNNDGSFAYTPATDFLGTDTFSYWAFDGSLFSAVVQVDIEVTATNTEPLARDDNYLATENTTLSINQPSPPNVGPVLQTDFNTAVPPEFGGQTNRVSVEGLAGLGDPTNAFSGSFIQNSSNPVAQGDPALPTVVTIDNLPPHESINIGFLLALFNGWDGNTSDFGGVFAPDALLVRVDGVTIFEETFDTGDTGDMSYNPPTGVQLAHNTDLGFGGGSDAAYDMSREPRLQNIPHTDSSVTIEWVAAGDGYRVSTFFGREQESFAIDNVTISVNATTDEEFETVEYISADSDNVPSPGSVWAYLDDGSDQGTAWREPAFDDSSWPRGPSQLGYGDGDEATVISYGPDANMKYVTTYYRHTFSVENADLVQRLDLAIKRDDGAVVYLNGTEIARDNLPPNPAYDTFANNGSPQENQFLEFPHIDTSLLVDGDNVIAVEIHQDDRQSSDTSMDLRLTAQVRTAPEFSTYGVLNNDRDPDGGPLQAELVDGPANGILDLAPDGTFSYTPAPNFFGIDTFTYRARDPFSQSASATVTITVEPGPNDAPTVQDHSYNAVEDTALSISAAAGLLVGANDTDGDPLIAAVAEEPTHGQVVVADDGSFVYTPNPDFFGTDSFTFVANDGSTNSPAGTVTIDVSGRPDAPRATADRYFVRPDTFLTVGSTGGVLSNDVEVDGQAMTAVLVNTTSHGSLNLGSNGSFTYSPDAGYRGTDTFTYRASDGASNSPVTTVTLVVNSPPVGQQDTYSVDEDEVLSVAAPGVLDNDQDVEGDALSAELSAGVLHGNLLFNPDGSFTYTPSENYHGEDSFTYRVISGGQRSSLTTVQIDVNPVNDPPEAIPDEYQAILNEPLVISVANGVLANDTDVENSPLTAQLVPNSGPDHGTLSLNADGSFTYTPVADYQGPDQFSYVASDGTLLSSTTVVDIDVTDGGEAVVISEIMYHPSSENNAEEYLELLNRGENSIDLTGWRLNQGVDFTFPVVTIAPQSHVIVAADVATFLAKYPGVTVPVVGGWEGQLSNSGEDVELEDATGERIDLVSYADSGDWAVRRIQPDSRAGRDSWEWVAAHDGGGRSLELINPLVSNNYGQNWASSTVDQGTPGAANSVANTETAPLIFDVSHRPAVPRPGDPVRIRAELRDVEGSELTAVVYYRVANLNPGPFLPVSMFDDGLHDDKDAGDHVFAVELPPQVNGTVVEFYIAASDGTLTRTYPAPSDDFGTQGANLLYQVDNETHDGDQPIYRVVMTELERDRLANLTRNSNAQMNATWINVDGVGSEVRYNAGVRYRGNGSRGREVPNYRVNLPSDKPWQGVDALNLNAQYTHSQVVGMTIFELAGLISEEANAVQLRINGFNRATQANVQYGSYARLEVTNGDFVDNHQPNDPSANVYRGLNGRLEYLGESPNSYRGRYDKQTNASEDDWSDLIALTRALDPAQTPDNVFVETVQQVADINQWMRFIATNTLLVNEENGLINGRGDDYTLLCGVTDPRCQLVPHDLDTVMAEGDGSANEATPTRDIFEPRNLPAFDRLMSFPEFLRMYYFHLEDLANSVFAPENMDAHLDNLLGDWVTPNTITRMKQFNLERVNYVLSQIPPGYARPVHATIDDLPAAETPVNSTNITVGGASVTHYQYRLNGGALSGEFPVSTPLTLTSLAAGDYTLEVIGRNTQGVFQSEASAATYSWTVVPANSVNIVISEVLAHNESAFNHEGTFPDAIELHNMGSTTVNLSGMTLSDDPSVPDRFAFPAGTTIGAGQRLVVFANDPDGTSGLHAGFGLDNTGEGVYLYANPATGGALIDAVEFGVQLADHSIGRLADFTFALNTPTLGGPNVSVPTGDPTNLRINEWLADGRRFRSDDFIEIYNPGSQPVDLGGMYMTDVPDGYRDKHQFRPLSFVGGEDYLVLVADGRQNAGGDHLDFGVNSNRDAIALYDKHLQLVHQVVVLSQTTDISEGLTPDGGLLYAFYGLPTPGLPNVDNPQAAALLASLRITELMYNPDGPVEEQEFLELQNTSDLPLDISGVRIRGGITFDFPTRVLAPGEILVVAKDLAAFEARYGSGINVIGEYSGNLSNGGEEISLEMPQPLEIAILRFEYNDNPDSGWPAEADGEGPSLVIVDTEGDYSDAENWVASAVVGGTPGRPGVTIPGDFNRDGLLDAQDVNALVAEIAAGTNNSRYELTGNNVVDVNDLVNWVTIQYGTLMGDANLDYSVDGRDFNAWNQHKFTLTAGGWTRGDFNGDGAIDGLDLNTWNSNKFRSASPAAAARSATPRAPLAQRVQAVAIDGAIAQLTRHFPGPPTSLDSADAPLKWPQARTTGQDSETPRPEVHRFSVRNIGQSLDTQRRRHGATDRHAHRLIDASSIEASSIDEALSELFPQT